MGMKIDPKKLLNRFEAEQQITELVRERANGGVSRLQEAVAVARVWDLDVEDIKSRFAVAEFAFREPPRLEIVVKEEASLVVPITQPKAAKEPESLPKMVRPVEVKWRQIVNGWEYSRDGGKVWRRHFGPAPKGIKSNPLLKEAKAKQMEAVAKSIVAKVEPVAVTAVAAKTGLPAVIDVPEGQVNGALKASMDWLNHRYALILNYGGKCVVLNWVPSEVDRSVLIPSYQSIAAFKQGHADTYVPTVGGAMPIAEAWLRYNEKSKYDTVAFVPGGPSIIASGRGIDAYQSLNLWRGWGIEPKEGDWSKMREHVRVVLAGGNEESEEYILNWHAGGYQDPAGKRGVGVGFLGDEGGGKGIFGHGIRRTYGNHGFYITNPDHLVGKFNVHLRTCCFLFVDEAFWAHGQQGEGTLRSLITDGVMMSEIKGGSTDQVPNRIDVMFASNDKWIVPAGANARRWAVFNIDERYCKDRCSDEERRAYFTALGAEMDGGGLAAMMWDLMRRDLSKWDPEDVPKTEALIEQKRHSLKSWDRWYEDILQEGVLPRRDDWDGRPDCATSHAMLQDAKKIRGLEHESYAALKKYLLGMGADITWRVPMSGRGGAKFASLVEAREIFAKKFGGKWPWVEDLEKWRNIEI
jgi:hypothetical protein